MFFKKVKRDLEKEIHDAIRVWLDHLAPNSQRQYMATVRELQEVSPLAKVGPREVSEWLAKTKSRPGYETDRVAGKTVKRKLIILTTVFNMLVRHRLIDNNPFLGVTFKAPLHGMPNRRPHTLISEWHIKQVLNLPQHHTHEEIRDRLAICLLYAGGLRINELTSLRLGYIRVTRDNALQVILRATKGNLDSVVELPTWVRPYWDSYREIRLAAGASLDDPLFIVPSRNKAISVSTLFRNIKSLFAKAGIDATVHSLRGSGITHLLQKGVSHRDVMRHSRHSSVTMVEKYDLEKREEFRGVSELLLSDSKKVSGF